MPGMIVPSNGKLIYNLYSIITIMSKLQATKIVNDLSPKSSSECVTFFVVWIKNKFNWSAVRFLYMIVFIRHTNIVILHITLFLIFELSVYNFIGMAASSTAEGDFYDQPKILFY